MLKINKQVKSRQYAEKTYKEYSHGYSLTSLTPLKLELNKAEEEIKIPEVLNRSKSFHQKRNVYRLLDNNFSPLMKNTRTPFERSSLEKNKKMMYGNFNRYRLLDDDEIPQNITIKTKPSHKLKDFMNRMSEDIISKKKEEPKPMSIHN